MRIRTLVLVLVLSAGILVEVPGAAAQAELVWYVEGAAGEALDSRLPDEPINPASVVKLATSLSALERLGPDHRFETRFVIDGALDAETGVLEGDLVVRGGGDPDFHVENAVLVARALNEVGLREVRGRLLVDGRFWFGWEGGAARKVRDPARRAELMAARVRDALDPSRWKSSARREVERLTTRREIDLDPPPRVLVKAGVGVAADESDVERAGVVHRSNPLAMTLRRFNAYSNNDVERLQTVLGEPAALARDLARRWEVSPDRVRFETLSGLGSNRMTPRLVVRLLWELVAVCERLEIDPREVVPVAGCDPGTMEMFPELGRGDLAGTVMGKTGTLTTTDGGVSVLAGVARTAAGDRTFCAAAPGVGRNLAPARRAQQEFVLQLIARGEGPARAGCPPPLPFSDDLVEVLRLAPLAEETSQPSP